MAKEARHLGICTSAITKAVKNCEETLKSKIFNIPFSYNLKYKKGP